MEIQKEQIEDQLIYYVEEKGQRLAEIYSRFRGEDRIIIEHTEVSEVLAGKGVGKRLVDQVVEYAREHHLKIVPLCPFARALFEKSQGKYDDVL